MKRLIKRLGPGGILAVTALLALTACGGGSSDTSGARPNNPPASSAPTVGPSSSPSAGATEAASSVITIKGYKYSGPGTVEAGATVTVKNDDPVAHTVTADGKGGFDVKVDADATATFTAPASPGSYAYHCDYHSNMHGTLTVG